MADYERNPTPPKELGDFPGLSQGDLDAVEQRFTHYLFFENEKAGRKIWTTCCHNVTFVNKVGRTSTPADRLVLSAKHNGKLVCPYCGRMVCAKNRRLLRRGVKISEYKAVVFLHVSEDGNTVWAQGYWATRELMGSPAGPVLYKPTRVYRFQPGVADQWDVSYYGNCYKRMHYKHLEPCQNNGNAYYIPVGIDRLKDSFLKYTGYEEPLSPNDEVIWRMKGIRDDLIRYLTAAARYPRQVELLRKAGFNAPLVDLVYHWKKNSDVIDWKAKNPFKALGMDKQELRKFMTSSKSLDPLRVMKRIKELGGRISVEEAEALWYRIGIQKTLGILRRAKLYDVPINALLRYLEGFAAPRCHGMGATLSRVAEYWVDYIDMADRLGYDLSNPILQMPKDLEDKHDRAAQAMNAIETEIKKEAAEKRQKTAQKRYGFTMGGWIIRAPVDAAEIVAEGAALKHCVGGYADRHMKGVLTILFLRRADAPDKPYVTIEMQGLTMMQIHGFRNEREACPENPDKIPPSKTHKELLEVWQHWLVQGSKRNKDGTPMLPKMNNMKKEKKSA